MYNFYTDGSCDNGGNKQGSFAWVSLETKTGEAKYFKQTTSNIMEMSAVISAIKTTPEGVSVNIYSDSAYVIQGITSWIINWKRRGWVSSSGSAVKNKDLWEELDRECAKRKVKFYKVRGHSGILGNEIADTLAKLSSVRESDIDPKDITALIERNLQD